MDFRKRNEKLIINREMQFNELIKKVIPNPKFICIRLSDESSLKDNPRSNRDLSHCDVIEIITHIPVNTNNLNKLISEAGYKLFDVIYETDGLHFFVRKAGGKET